jgi:AraC-like DNA-binding protein
MECGYDFKERYRFIPASPDLRPWVCYYVITDDRARPQAMPALTRVPAMLTAQLHLHLGGVPSGLDERGRRREIPRYVFMGPFSRSPVVRNDCRPTYTITLCFRAGGWYDLVTPGASDLTDASCPASEAFKGAEQDLIARLESDASGPHLPIVEDWLRRLIRRRAVEDQAVIWLRRRLVDTSPSQLADEMGLSRRQLQRRLRRTLGPAPKAYQRLARLYYFHILIRGNRNDLFQPRTLADAAIAAGYHDQSHLDRDIRLVNGFSMGELRTRLAAGDSELDHFQSVPPIDLL